MKIYEDGTQLKRIADALEEVLRLVKEDQERSKKYMEDRKDDYNIKKRIPAWW